MEHSIPNNNQPIIVTSSIPFTRYCLALLVISSPIVNNLYS